MGKITFTWSRLSDLSGMQAHQIIAARESVFVVEQKCPYQEADHHDTHAWHLIAQSASEIAAYLRVVDPGHKYPEPSIGRVLTCQNFRGTGLGKLLMQEGIQRALQEFPGTAIRISAQEYLRKFYEGFNFRAVSESYLEDGIPHLEMLRLHFKTEN